MCFGVLLINFGPGFLQDNESSQTLLWKENLPVNMCRFKKGSY